LAKRDLVVSHANLWQLASVRDVKIRHAREVDRIFAELKARGAYISPTNQTFWQKIKQWLEDNAQ
jgi:predicted RNA-binding protein YlxR (DUF448 family)